MSASTGIKSVWTRGVPGSRRLGLPALVAAVMVACGAASHAQDLTPPPGSVELVPAPDAAAGSGARSATPSSAPLGPATSPLADEIIIENSLLDGEAYLLEPGAPALTESSGTWLRRGWWYARMDAVVLQRTWNGGDIVLAIDSDGDFDSNLDGSDVSPTPADNIVGVPVTIIDDGDTSRALVLQNSSPGREGSARLTLGRFLFRDTKNRDHTTELTYFGGGEFATNSSIVSDNQQADAPSTIANAPPQPIDSIVGRVNVLAGVDQGSDVSFDGAAASQIQYDSRFHNIEWNYVFTSRLRRDRMELAPNGDWIRRANTGWTHHGLFGLRYFDLDENIAWNADSVLNIDINPVFDALGNVTAINPAEGTYLVRTTNNLFGPQFGGGMTYESDRFNITFAGKGAVLANDSTSVSSLAFVDTATGAPITTAGPGNTVGFIKNDSEPTLSFLGQFSVTGRWHLRPNVSLRAGYEALLVTALALAPHQLNFSPADGAVVVSGDSFYHGISLGVEGYW